MIKTVVQIKLIIQELSTFTPTIHPNIQNNVYVEPLIKLDSAVEEKQLS